MLSTYYIINLFRSRPPAGLPSLPLASVTSVTSNYMPLKERWKNLGNEIATEAKTSLMGPSYVGKRALQPAQAITEGYASSMGSGNITLLGQAFVAWPLILVNHWSGEHVPEYGTQKLPCQVWTLVSVSSNE